MSKGGELLSLLYFKPVFKPGTYLLLGGYEGDAEKHTRGYLQPAQSALYICGLATMPTGPLELSVSSQIFACSQDNIVKRLPTSSSSLSFKCAFGESGCRIR